MKTTTKHTHTHTYTTTHTCKRFLCKKKLIVLMDKFPNTSFTFTCDFAISRREKSKLKRKKYFFFNKKEVSLGTISVWCRISYVQLIVCLSVCLGVLYACMWSRSLCDIYRNVFKASSATPQTVICVVI